MSRTHANKTAAKVALRILRYLVMTLIALLMLLPFYWSVITSMKGDQEIFKMTWLPAQATLAHYRRVFAEIPLARMFGNSLLVTLAGMATNLFFGALAAFSFAKIRFRGHKAMFAIMLASMMIPGCITLVPQYLVMARFPLAGGNDLLGRGGIGLVDSLAAVILPGCVGVYAVYFMRQFFLTLSDDMAEAARIDGAGELRIFLQLYLPLVLPGLMTLAIFTFQGGWNNFLWPSIVLLSPEKQLLTMAFLPYKSSLGAEYGPLMAVSVLMALPIIVLFVFAQKYFIGNVTAGAVKE